MLCSSLTRHFSGFLLWYKLFLYIFLAILPNQREDLYQHCNLFPSIFILYPVDIQRNTDRLLFLMPSTPTWDDNESLMFWGSLLQILCTAFPFRHLFTRTPIGWIFLITDQLYSLQSTNSLWMTRKIRLGPTSIFLITNHTKQNKKRERFRLHIFLDKQTTRRGHFWDIIHLYWM